MSEALRRTRTGPSRAATQLLLIVTLLTVAGPLILHGAAENRCGASEDAGASAVTTSAHPSAPRSSSHQGSHSACCAPAQCAQARVERPPAIGVPGDAGPALAAAPPPPQESSPPPDPPVPRVPSLPYIG